MPEYFFQLGHCPDLSQAEILSVNAIHGSPLSRFQRHADVLLARADSFSVLEPICRELGGTIRVCETVAASDGVSCETYSAQDLKELLVSCGIEERLPIPEKRGLFGLSLLSSEKSRKKAYGLLHDTAGLYKDYLKEKERGSRFVLPAPDAGNAWLSSAQVDKNSLLSKGLDVVMVLEGKSLRVGISQWIQGYEAFSQRDYGRPQRDAKSGMLPPKLARMMMNLGRTAETRTLLDPFCGSGSVLNEAALSGLKAVGFDTSGKAIADTNANWRWIGEHVGDCPGSVRAMEGDARQLHTLCEPLFFDCCATEPYLGPPRNKPVPKEAFPALSKELKELYARALGEIRTVVKPGGRVVFVTPRFQVRGSETALSINMAGPIQLLGYRFLDPMEDFRVAEKKTALIYSRPQQIVQREIYVLQA